MLELIYIPYDFIEKKYLVSKDIYNQPLSKLLGKLLVLGAKIEEPTVALRIVDGEDKVYIHLVRGVGCPFKLPNSELNLLFSPLEPLGSMIETVTETLYEIDMYAWFAELSELEELVNNIADALGQDSTEINNLLPQLLMDVTVSLNKVQHQDIESVAPSVGDLKALVFLNNIRPSDLELLVDEWHEGMNIEPLINGMVRRAKFVSPYGNTTGGINAGGGKYLIHTNITLSSDSNDIKIHYQFSYRKEPDKVLGYAEVSKQLDLDLSKTLVDIGKGYLAKDINNDDSVVIHKLFVYEEYRGKGIAKDIISYLIEQARTHNIPRLVLQAHPLELDGDGILESQSKMSVLRKFYDGMNFKTLLEQEVQGRTLPVVLYHKPINSTMCSANLITPSNIFN